MRLDSAPFVGLRLANRILADERLLILKCERDQNFRKFCGRGDFRGAGRADAGEKTEYVIGEFFVIGDIGKALGDGIIEICDLEGFQRRDSGTHLARPHCRGADCCSFRRPGGRGAEHARKRVEAAHGAAPPRPPTVIAA